jgi:membrane protease YdiL (CAAX protease family)
MTPFQQTSLLLTAFWLTIVAIRYRRSTIVLIGGLVAIGLYTLVAFLAGKVTAAELGLAMPTSWWRVVVFAAAWTAIMFAYSPFADRLATRAFAEPPTLGSFRAIQQSRVKLIAGIAVAWVLGGILEELVFRGIVVKSVESLLTASLIVPIAAAVAVCVAALGAGLIHFYQGYRAMVIITQLSILFGVLFVISGYSLWTVMLCHGMYDTIAFIRFANKKSKYSNLDRDSPLSSGKQTIDAGLTL